jgi:hypothetical protein
MQLADEQHAGTDQPKQEPPQNAHPELGTTNVIELKTRGLRSAQSQWVEEAGVTAVGGSAGRL